VFAYSPTPTLSLSPGSQQALRTNYYEACSGPARTKVSSIPALENLALFRRLDSAIHSLKPQLLRTVAAPAPLPPEPDLPPPSLSACLPHNITSYLSVSSGTQVDVHVLLAFMLLRV
jgi:hypothetical protein